MSTDPFGNGDSEYRGDAEQAPLSEELSTFREILADTVQRAAEQSGTEVFAAGQSLQGIVNHAQKQAQDLRSVAGLVDPKAGGQATVGGALDAQHGAVQSFLAAMLRHVERQNQSAEQASVLNASILQLAKTTASIELQFRILTINIRVEAARLGEAGNAVGVIADELSSLSRSVGRVNADIGTTSAKLAQLLPAIHQAAKDVRADSEAFEEAFSAKRTEVSERWSDLLNHMRDTMQRNEQRTEKMLVLSRDAISHLQFQDSMAQELLQLEQRLEEATQASGISRDSDVVNDSSDAGDSDPDAGSALDKGDMLLF